MKKSEFACDWCQLPKPETQMFDIVVTPIGKLYPRELKAEICNDCLRQIHDKIQRIAVRAQDGRELAAGAGEQS
jgi:hypothetical protein